MNDLPLISCIMPCNRPEDVPLAVEIFLSQDYKNKELLILMDRDQFDQVKHYRSETVSIYQLHDGYAQTIGAKRNWLNAIAKGDIVFMQDSDDYIASDFLTRSYNHLVATGADTTGLASAYFYQPHTKMWKYEYKGAQKYVLGSAMMYYKRVWQRRPFPDQQIGEDAAFLANAGRIIPHNYINGFLAVIHGKNTNSHTQTLYMKRVSPEIAKDILGEWYGRY